MRMTGAQIVTHLLERQGVQHIAGIPGGANLPLYDALRESTIRHVLARHEQGAGFIAQGIARTTGRAAVCYGTSGPGATNLLTAIADAKLDSIPVVAITGQVPSPMLGTDAFQEVDTFGLSRPITKHNFLVRDARDLLEVVPQAFEIAESGRPGPVLIDIPKDVQTAEVEFPEWPEPARRGEGVAPNRNAIARLAEALFRSERPVIYAGGGVIASDACDLLQSLARRISAPVTTTLMGLGAFPAGDPLDIGMLGMHGARYTNHVLEEADLLIVVGARFDDRATGKVECFCPAADVAHIDIDASEINKIRRAQYPVAADARGALSMLLDAVEPQERREWLARVDELRSRYPLDPPSVPDGMHPHRLLRRLASMLPEDTVVATDVGQHQMWVAQAYPFRRPRTLLTSGGLGTMGFGLPAAIGAGLADANRPVLCVTGDGSLLMNIQELATLAELDLDVAVLLMNNGHLGLVRQQQELFYGARYHASRFESRTDFAAIARGFGVRAFDLSRESDPAEVLDHAMSLKGPRLIDVPMPAEWNVFPMVPPGAANRDMIGEQRAAASV